MPEPRTDDELIEAIERPDVVVGARVRVRDRAAFGPIDSPATVLEVKRYPDGTFTGARVRLDEPAGHEIWIGPKGIFGGPR